MNQAETIELLSSDDEVQAPSSRVFDVEVPPAHLRRVASVAARPSDDVVELLDSDDEDEDFRSPIQRKRKRPGSVPTSPIDIEDSKPSALPTKQQRNSVGIAQNGARASLQPSLLRLQNP